MDYKEVIESRYNRQSWQLLLHDIFGNKVKFWATPSEVPTSSPFAHKALWLGTITLSDEQTIAIYEVELAESVDIERNRRGIRDMLLTDWRNNGNAGAFMFCYRKNESVLRFSYVSESWKFADDGSLQKESTDTKRFTYLLGEGHRSRTAIQQFEKLRDSKLSLQDLTKAFSVEAVSDMFFRGYKQQYEDIIFFVTGKLMVKVSNKWEERQEGTPNVFIMEQFARFDNPEKAVRDYVKKLMGRLVFLQYLQKKGWLGVPVSGKWGDGDLEFVQHLFENCSDKDHFVDKVLEVLFDDLNTERKGDISQLSDKLKVPYLNGGLFEREATDETEFPLPAKYMQNLLEFFASYNFTIDENDPDDAEVGVDPEMLGRIFENLLEDNKDKGAFYTPKEIVQYMCRESLIAYLQTDVEDEATKEAIREFVTTHDADVLGNIADDIDQLLKDVKICDPAIGSGAFPMGLLKELFLCRTALEGFSQEKAAEIKKHIIQQNIYGVDIERGAVDIARLRFWLALIVDEETPQALPNLDFKIMQGNSLLEQYNGVDLSTMTEKKADATGMLTIFDDMLDVYRQELRDMLAKYYDCPDHDEKAKLREKIVNNVKQQLREQSIDVNFGDLDLSGNSQFMLWHTWNYDVFSRGGFDIVIGNPPYGVSIKGQYRKEVVGFLGNVPDYEIYYYFIQTAEILLKKKGVLSYIIPNTYLFNNFAKKYRSNILDKWRVIEILDCTKFKIFESATVLNTINLWQKDTENNKFIGYRNTADAESFLELIKSPRLLMDKCELLKMNQNWGLAFFLSNNVVTLINKICSQPYCISDFYNCSQGYIPYRLSDLIITYGKEEGTKIKNQRLWHSKKKTEEYYIQEIYGRDITKYNYSATGEYIKYGRHVACYVDPAFFTSPRLLVREITNPTIIACYVEEPYINDPQLLPIITKDGKKENLYYLWGVLNSKVATFYHFNHSPKATKGAFPKILVQDIKDFPLPNVSESNKNKIIALVLNIMNMQNQKGEDVSSLENKIDHLVYQLYGLTDEEIKIVEGKEQ